MTTEVVDKRNVADKFKNWTTELIKENIKSTCFPFATLMEQIIGDFNFGTMIRNSNAFNATEVFYFGEKRHYDKRSAVGCYNYTDVNYLSTREQMNELKNKYVFIGIDCVPGSIPMESFEWPKNTLMLFGEEGRGLTPETLQMCDAVVHISQYGSVRSLNVGTASGIAMFDYVNKFQKNI